MPVFQRFDRVPIATPEPMAAGGLRIPATVSRTGIQEYRDGEGRTIREYRPPESVFAADSLASFASAPVTIGHPRDFVTPQNRQALSVGHVSDAAPIRVDDDGASWVSVPLIVTHADAIQRIQSKDLREISVGYAVDVDNTPGITPQGEKYDAIQRGIVVNHVALLRDGHARAGRGARLRIDGHETAPEGLAMVKFDGKDYEENSPELVAAMSAALDSARNDAKAATAALETAKAEHVQALGALSALHATEKSRADAAEERASDEQIAKRADEMAAVLVRTREIVGAEYDAKGKTADAMRADAIQHAVSKGLALEIVDSAEWRKGAFAALPVAAKPADSGDRRYASNDERKADSAAAPLTFADYTARVGAAKYKGESK